MKTTRIARIFLDLDDVLNCFVPYVLWRLECDISPISYSDYPIEAGWDIIKAANILHPSRKFTADSFWGSVTREMWASVPPSSNANILMDRAAHLVGRENTFILTAPTLDPDCLAGKLEWIQRRCPKWIQRQYLIGPPKHLCAQPDTLLVDDREANVTLFRKHGGQALLVPRPWNSLREIGDSESYTVRELCRTASR